MLFIVKVLLWALVGSILLIPLVRWFWKRWDSPSKESREYIAELKVEQQEKEVWQEAEKYEAAVQKVREKWTKSKVTAPMLEEKKSAAIEALLGSEGAAKAIETQAGPSAPPDPTAAAAVKQGSKVIESEISKAEKLFREEGDLPPEDIGKGAIWRRKQKSDQDDWGDIDW
ncbi:MAG: hypothetical protein HN696_00480 [Euryarchaeota archaeon]|nr:hypothetical protein [Euryarchaeota archaeon]